jgi:4-carboxymuconolactone decarboxylase
MLRSPVVGHALQNLGATLRYKSSLPPRVREIVILAVAAAERSTFERTSHEAIARIAGLTTAELDAVRRCDTAVIDEPLEAAALTTAHALATNRDLDDAVYADALGLSDWLRPQ